VIFGKASGFAGLVALGALAASDGFKIQGDLIRDYAGGSVSSANAARAPLTAPPVRSPVAAPAAMAAFTTPAVKAAFAAPAVKAPPATPAVMATLLPQFAPPAAEIVAAPERVVEFTFSLDGLQAKYPLLRNAF